LKGGTLLKSNTARDKRIGERFILVGTCAASLLLLGCGPRPQDCARPDVFCVGLVTDFGSTTEGINQEAWLALQDARAAGLVDRIDRIETVDIRDRAANIATLGDSGYDVIVTVGASISDETIAAAKRYPSLVFVGLEQPQQKALSNLVGLVFHEERSGFLAGALAALMTQTGHLAAVCESRYVDSIRRYCDGFKAGAEYATPSIVTSVSYRDGPAELLFHDPDWAKATAMDDIDQGADVVFAVGGATADGALRAAAAGGALVIGSETDVYPRLVDVRPRLLTSAVNDIRTGVRQLLLLARDGRVPSGEFAGQIALAPFHDLDGRIPATTKARLAEIAGGLEDGTIEVNVPYVNP
jgi:basic membrane protein A